MPKPKNKYDREHLRNLDVYQEYIDAIYAEAVKEAAAIGVSLDDVDTGKPFTFDDYPKTRKRIKALLEKLRSQLQMSIVNAVRSEWTLSNNKNNELCNVVFGKNVGKLSEEQYRRYYSTNEKAREAFIKRKERGLTLSDRVWNYSNTFKREIEMGLDLGIREGVDAPTMARDLKQYLRHPDKLFRRVRDEHGNLHLSKNAADFHPGRGVYRSSYMNARRLAATEANIAYRTADHERWQKMDFVVGIEIHLSNNHTCRGRDGKPHPFMDICDELKGKYPKDFKFTGWHPHCRCFATSVLKTDEEIAEDTRRILNGEEVTGDSVNEVKEPPEGFEKWVEKNEGRIAEAKKNGTLPGFLRENEGYARVKVERSDQKPHKHGGHKMMGRSDAKEAFNLYKDEKNNVQPVMTVEQIENRNQLAKKIGLNEDEVLPNMTHDEADTGKANIDSKKPGGDSNCALAVLAYEARRRGINATANLLDENDKTSWCYKAGADEHSHEVWVDAGKTQYVKVNKGVVDKKSLNKKTQAIGRYHLSWDFVTPPDVPEYGHSIVAERLVSGDLVLYCPKDDIYYGIGALKDIVPGSFVVRRVDNLLFNVEALSKIIRRV